MFSLALLCIPVTLAAAAALSVASDGGAHHPREPRADHPLHSEWWSDIEDDVRTQNALALFRPGPAEVCFFDRAVPAPTSSKELERTVKSWARHRALSCPGGLQASEIEPLFLLGAIDERLHRELLSSEDPAILAAALSVLGHGGVTLSIDELLCMVADQQQSIEVRAAAVRAVGSGTVAATELSHRISRALLDELPPARAQQSSQRRLEFAILDALGALVLDGALYPSANDVREGLWGRLPHLGLGERYGRTLLALGKVEVGARLPDGGALAGLYAFERLYRAEVMGLDPEHQGWHTLGLAQTAALLQERGFVVPPRFVLELREFVRLDGDGPRGWAAGMGLMPLSDYGDSEQPVRRVLRERTQPVRAGPAASIEELERMVCVAGDPQIRRLLKLIELNERGSDAERRALALLGRAYRAR